MPLHTITCDLCGNKFTSVQPYARFCNKTECKRFCNMNINDRTRYLKKHNLNRPDLLNSLKQLKQEQKQKKQKEIESEPLDGMDGEIKAIKKYQELSKQIVTLMRKNRISKYRNDTQSIITSLMETCYKHLNNELHKKEVIDIDWK